MSEQMKEDLIERLWDSLATKAVAVDHRVQ